MLCYKLEEKDKGADLIIVNTCAVTKTAIKKDKRMIKKARLENPGSSLVIMGCWPQAYQEDLESVKADLLWGSGRISELGFKIACQFGLKKNEVKENHLNPENRTRYFIKIQDGCEQFCSYCIIPYTRGALKSRPFPEVEREFREAVSSGFQEIILTGIHLGLYGVESEKSLKLTGLLKKLVKAEGLGRIRLSSIEVTETRPELIDLIKSSEKICPHLHIPLQSGSDKILNLMNRPYSTSFFRKKIKDIRSRIPEVAVSTDVIVGFPGETERDFKKTLDFVKEIGFSRLHIFPFSPHPQTPAADLKGEVSDEEKKNRTLILKDTGKKLEKDFRQNFKGKVLHPLVEKISGERARGKTEYYFDLDFSLKNSRVKEERGEEFLGKIFSIKN